MSVNILLIEENLDLRNKLEALEKAITTKQREIAQLSRKVEQEKHASLVQLVQYSNECKNLNKKVRYLQRDSDLYKSDVRGSYIKALKDLAYKNGVEGVLALLNVDLDDWMKQRGNV